MTEEKVYKTFEEFYPYYLTEHQNQTCIRLHVIGTTIALLWGLYTLLTAQYNWFLFGFVIAYFHAWVGHFFFEKNKPASFKYPLMSLRGDFRMTYEIYTGKRPF